MKQGNILVVTYWPWHSGIFNSYALPYIRQIRKILPSELTIDILTLTPADDQRATQLAAFKKELTAEGMDLIDHNYQRFGVKMAWQMTGMVLSLRALLKRKNIQTVHAWCTPGGALGYLLVLFSGRKLILDSFEPHAETMIESGTWKTGSLNYKILYQLEKRQYKSAERIIYAAPGMGVHAAAVYHVPQRNGFVKPACVDLTLFDPAKCVKPSLQLKSVVCVYAGKFGGIYLTRETFDFFKVAYDHWQGDFSVLLLTNHKREEIQAWCEQAGIPIAAITCLEVPHREVPNYMSLGHFGICPVKPLPSKRYCTPIKDGEYWAMGLPVVITSGISIDSELIEHHNIGYVLRNTDTAEYEKAVSRIDELMKDKSLHSRIRKIAETERSFTIAENIYNAIYGENSPG